MKEYLTKKTDGTYTLTLGGGDIEVPEGADIYVEFSRKHHTFYRSGFKEVYQSEGWGLTHFTSENLDYWNNLPILWQRHTKPEELPFVDDEPKEQREHNHYFKDVSDINTIDVYEVLYRFGVTDPCLQHIVKKALCAGQRGHKDFETDLQNIRDTAIRAIEINCKP